MRISDWSSDVCSSDLILPAWVVLHLEFLVVLKLQALDVHVQAAGVVQDFRRSVIWRQFDTTEHVKCRKALLHIQQHARSNMLLIVLVRAFKYRWLVCLPRQHCYGEIFLTQGVYHLI